MTNLYTIFHGNLQFSSIPKREYRTVVNQCYWPLIRIVEKNERLKFGIEFNGLTLLEIKKLDQSFINRIKKLINEERLEFIGSSYTQAIFPLIPYEVTLKNLELGIEIYKKLLGQTPKVFYVNEQTFSDGLISLYKEAGIKNIIVDFDSTPDNVRLNKSLLYKPTKIISHKGEKLTAIWASSIAFQKFQRYVFDEIPLEDYRQYLFNHLNKDENRYFPLYVGDWEVFGFSPKGINRNYQNDFKRMAELFVRLSKEKEINFILPHQLIEKGIPNPQIRLTDSQDPIVCKKQEKYNVSRWALAGKNTIFRNTQCFSLFSEISSIKKRKSANKSIIEKMEENLVRLWGSDYRTNTTEDKNREYERLYAETETFLSEMSSISEESKPTSKVFTHAVARTAKFRLLPENGKIKTDHVELTLDWRKGATIRQLTFPKIFPKKMAGLIPHGYFQNQQLSADWFSGHCLFETDTGKHTDLYPTKIFVNKNSNGDIHLFSEIKTSIGTIRKNYKVYQDLPRVDLQYVFNFKKVGLKSARIGNVTLDPVNFDQSSLWYATVNGGKSKEVYEIGNSFVAQDEIVSFRISSRGCLGATEGWLAVGDKYKALALIWDKGELASCPIVHFEKTPQGLFARIQPSIAESDETGFPVYEGIFSFGISYFGLKSFHELDMLNIPLR